MKYAAALLLGAVIYASSTPPTVTRVHLASLERKIDQSIIKINSDQPGDILGTTRGVYLAGYGAVFSTEVELLPYAALNPFRPDYTKAEITRLKGTKQLRLSILRLKMRDAMINAASALDSVPVKEQIAYAVTIPYFRWEDSAGMPRQILMSAPKSVLLQGSRGDTAAVDKAMQVQEF